MTEEERAEERRKCLKAKADLFDGFYEYIEERRREERKELIVKLVVLAILIAFITFSYLADVVWGIC